MKIKMKITKNKNKKTTTMILTISNNNHRKKIMDKFKRDSLSKRQENMSSNI